MMLAVLTLAAGPPILVSPPPPTPPALDGAQMGWPWALPFVGILLSIATGPLLFPKFWHASLRQDRRRAGRC